MTEKGGGGGKLHDIKETASDAVEIMRELGTPGVRESFDIIKETAVIAKEIMETMKTPEWQQNMQNIRIISENMNNASARMDRTTKELKETGIIDDTKDLIKGIKSRMGPSGDSKGQQTEATGTMITTTGSGSISGQDLKDLSVSFKEMLQSIKALVEELKATMVESKRSGTMHNVEETFREAADTYRTVKGELEKEK
jgi:CRISPR/Cas system-associated exonuclease Cas4 (RecB family)